MLMFNQLKDWIVGHPLDLLLKPYVHLKSPRCLICWNRGLGDIPLGLYALCVRIRKTLPDAHITFLTRPDLEEAFCMLQKIDVIIDPQMKRGGVVDVKESLNRVGQNSALFDIVLEKVHATRWLRFQIGKVTPKLYWDSGWESEEHFFGLEASKSYLGVHVSSETSQFYGYEKNWSQASFQKLFDQLQGKQKILLFGFNPHPVFHGDHLIDLRGKTSLKQMIALIKQRCSHVLAPDSGILSMVYYVDEQFPLKVVSLWADPKQGVLRQKVASPNQLLQHHPLIGRKNLVENISVEQVLKALYCEQLV